MLSNFSPEEEGRTAAGKTAGRSKAGLFKRRQRVGD